MRQIFMLISGIACLLAGVSAQRSQNIVNSPFNRHLSFTNAYYASLKNTNGGNVATSPLGIDELLLMITFAANEERETFKQLNNIVRLPRQSRAFSESHASVDTLRTQKFPNIELRMINRLYVDRKVTIRSSYQKKLHDYFHTRCTKVNFRYPEMVVQRINEEVALDTDEKIINAIPPGSVDGNTLAILMNVLYFKGKWRTPFEKSATILRPFFQNGITSLNVPTMYVKGTFRMFYDSRMDATVVEIPYENAEFSMIIILPTEDTNLKQVEDKLQFPALWSELVNFWEEEIELYLPKFKIESSLDLKPILERMGVRDLFTENADLSKMTPTKRIRVSRIQQKVFLEVNEEGAEAAAVSSVVITNRSGSPSIHVDRPFLAILRYKNLNLFTARITNPLG